MTLINRTIARIQLDPDNKWAWYEFSKKYPIETALWIALQKGFSTKIVREGYAENDKRPS